MTLEERIARMLMTIDGKTWMVAPNASQAKVQARYMKNARAIISEVGRALGQTLNPHQVVSPPPAGTMLGHHR